MKYIYKYLTLKKKDKIIYILFILLKISNLKFEYKIYLKIKKYHFISLINIFSVNLN